MTFAMTFAMLPDLLPILPKLIFTGIATVTVLSAILAATTPKIVHAAFGLMATLLGMAGLYAMLGADFVALAQIVVYVGGILVLLVFGVLLTGRTRYALGLARPQRGILAVLAGGVFFLAMILAISASDFNVTDDPGAPEATTAGIGRAFLDPNQYLVPFELASVLLLAALVGAAYLARRRRQN